ncbi:hypothetical protein C8J56DRAFT_933959 [Mycena floridula]|nr:hypothetical protein C8J56DRAFT_933959 [Mycena floridula]
MDLGEWGASSALAGLPYFNPMMMINLSGSCGATKLIQCRNFGTYENDISRKFMKSPEEAPDLSRDDFLARKQILQQVEEAQSGSPRHTKWVPILYNFEVVRGSAKRQRDWGHLVFIDTTTTRFLLVMIFPNACNCGNFDHHDYASMTEYQANRLLSLAKAVYHQEQHPKWVRATYTTQSEQYRLDPLFISGQGQIPSKIFHVTAEAFTPSLLPGEVDRIDSVLKQGNKGVIPETIRTQVIGDKTSRPSVGPAWTQRNARQCAFCEKIQEKDLKQCSRCRLVNYCNTECQRAAWPTHKKVCKA